LSAEVYPAKVDYQRKNVGQTGLFLLYLRLPKPLELTIQQPKRLCFFIGSLQLQTNFLSLLLMKRTLVIQHLHRI